MHRIHSKLIEILKVKTPVDETPSDVLMDLFSFNKEAAYRRLRGDILLTLDEAVILAKNLRVSLDNLIEDDHENKSVFHIIPYRRDSINYYVETLRNVMYTYEFLKSDPDSIAYIAGKVFTPTFYLKCDGLTKLVLTRWSYLLRKNTGKSAFSEMVIPPQFEELRQPFRNVGMQVPTVNVFHDGMFSAVVNDILYRYKIHLLTREDISILKKEMLLLFDEIETIAINGCYENGTKVSIYIADTYFDISYHYLRGNGMEVCGIGVYMLNFLSNQDPEICNYHRIWIESLIRYSTSITCCGESQRVAFFNKQRDKLKSLDI